ncbi:MAG: electron transport complex subunit RsxC [Candidatus Omnitrophota bacterium]|nr:electron transport complex subunit RsxC [Candidatus Omnitrophota bacterium]
MIKLEEHKHLSADQPIEKLTAPAKVYIPLSQHLGKVCAPLVKAGESVLLGQKIGAAEAHVYAPVHASVSGKVAAVQDWPHPALGRCKAVVLENDGLDRGQGTGDRGQGEIDKLSAEEIRRIVLEAGIVGMGGAGFPTHLKLAPPQPVDTLIINGAECEPYLTCDYRLMLEKTGEILRGVDLIKRCLGVNKVIIAIEDNKPAAIKAFTQDARHTTHDLKILKSQYPQGGEKQLIKQILRKEVPSGKLPFDVGVVVQNVATALSVYEAVYLGKPLYERVVTVTGGCLTQPKNLLARLGTPISALITACAPLKREPAKIIVGGPMMGIAQYTTDVPVIKSTSGVVLLDEKEAKAWGEEFCIRCGACVRECPAGLMPCLINLASEKGMWEKAKDYRAMDCMECGLCNYVCPANRFLTQSIKRAKLEVGK